jgi:hypothetical protein
VILDKVECRGFPGQSYALYIPSAYDPAKKWPILYAFDAGGRAREPIIRFKDAAEARGWIVACSYNSRNGSWEPIYAAAAMMWQDTHERLALDDGRVYAAGSSGGARAATIFSRMIGRPVAGVIACAAGLIPGGKVEDLQIGAFYGIAGTGDFNYLEVMALDDLLDRRPDIDHWVRSFSGGHSWPPESECAEAVAWLDCVSQKKAGLAPDRKLVEDLIAGISARSADFEARGYVFRAAAELEAAASALSGMGNADGLRARAAEVRKTKAFRKSAEKEEIRRREEADLLNQLHKCLADNEKTMPFPDDVARLSGRIDRLCREAGKANDASDREYATRVLLNITERTRDRGAGFLDSNAPAKAAFCFEIAVRATGFQPAYRAAMSYNLACAHARSGNIRKALDSLRRAVAAGFTNKDLLLTDKDLDAVRDTPEFREILAGIR